MDYWVRTLISLISSKTAFVSGEGIMQMVLYASTMGSHYTEGFAVRKPLLFPVKPFLIGHVARERPGSRWFVSTQKNGSRRTVLLIFYRR